MTIVADTAIEDPRIRVRVRGLVQGVGFRPTVWRIAHELGVIGEVHNDGAGVAITAIAPRPTLDAFIAQIRADCPPLARIDAIEQDITTTPCPVADFVITASRPSDISTGVVADAATCPACHSDIADSANRRYRYPFTNCTHCGPRFSIIFDLPYDRAGTTMSEFRLCTRCRREYEDPANRRFHAQPNACPECGPKVWLTDHAGARLSVADPIDAAALLITAGRIVAIKGIGGIHLACDATNELAVRTLRERKHRPDKPLAMMGRDIEQIAHFCHVDAAEHDVLLSTAAPIVVLRARSASGIAANVAPDQRHYGFMLPYSPLHHLLLAALQCPTVLTSGNRSDEPQCTDNDDALARLGDIADAFLLHDRAIANRIDDSVVRVHDGGARVLRRARGYAPGRMELPAGFAAANGILALGGELKNTFCIVQRGFALLSQHIGDLEDARTYGDYRHHIELYQRLYRQRPTALAIDHHPEYLSSKLGRQWREESGVPLIEVQHHHAHIAACMADNGLGRDDGPVLGIALDGLGYGDDATLWGGEWLLADYLGYRRMAHLKPVAMPGGVQAIREPWRSTYAHLVAAFDAATVDRLAHSTALAACFANRPLAIIDQMIANRVNSPLASSAGRLFDAVAATLGLHGERTSFEGQAAMALEALANNIDSAANKPYPFAINHHQERWQLDPTPCWRALVADLDSAVAPALIAKRFHVGFAAAVVATTRRVLDTIHAERVVLSGGVFQNQTLSTLVEGGLQQMGIDVLTHRQLPSNDGGLALGQAVIAAARLTDGEN